MKPAFDTYYNYAQISEILKTFAEEHPKIMSSLACWASPMKGVTSRSSS